MSEPATVSIAKRRPAAMWNVRGDPHDEGFFRDVEAAFGVALPRAPNTASGVETARALWLGPDEWLIVSWERPPGRETVSRPGGRSYIHMIFPAFTIRFSPVM